MSGLANLRISHTASSHIDARVYHTSRNTAFFCQQAWVCHGRKNCCIGHVRMQSPLKFHYSIAVRNSRKKFNTNLELMNSVFIIPKLGNFVITGFPGCLKWLLGVVGKVMLNKVSM